MLVRDTPPGNVEKGKCTMPAEGSILGHAVLRREDPSLLTGADRYYDDMAVDGLTHAYFVRSSFAHGTLNSVDVTAAATMPGVIAAHSADTFELAPFLSFPLMPPVTARPPLAKGKVRLVGDIVAVIVAETLAQAVDAAEAVVVDIDPLPAIIDPEAADGRGRAPAVRGARVERRVRDRDRPRGRRPARGRRPRVGMPHGQPASGRRSHGDQRLRRDPRRRRPAHRVDPEPEPGRRPRRARRPARHGSRQPPRRGADGRRRLRPQGRPLHRARPHQ